MKKTLIVMLCIIIIILIGLSFWGGINLTEIKEKVNSVKDNLSLTQDSLKTTIHNINKARKEIALAKKTIEQAKKDLVQLSDNLNKELSKMKTNIKLLENKRMLLDKKIAKIRNNIPGKLKVLKEPDYQKLGAGKLDYITNLQLDFYYMYFLLPFSFRSQLSPFLQAK